MQGSCLIDMHGILNISNEVDKSKLRKPTSRELVKQEKFIKLLKKAIDSGLGKVFPR
jgi:hypothetical protein